MPKRFIRSIDMTVSGANTLGLSEPGVNGNEGVFHIPQSSSIIGALPSNSGGARGVMVIVVGIGHDDTSSNLGRD